MTERPPRNATQLFAAQAGVAEETARRWLKRLPPSEEWDETDAWLRTLAALADRDAAAAVDDIDIADAAAADDPKAELREMMRAASDRHLRAKLAAHTRWSRATEDDRRRQTDKMREAFFARFEREVDPDGILEPAERRLRAEHARKAHMARLALASSKARRARKGR